MARVIVSPDAVADLVDIWEYISEDDERAADRMVDRIAESFQELSENPGMGVARSDLGVELRSFPVKNYLIFYRKLEGGVEVARVVSGYRDLAKLL